MDPARRFPATALRREVMTRHRRCVFPGCRHRATSVQLDHRRRHSRGGPTTGDNLAPGCGHDHPLKDRGGWILTRVQGAHLWTSPLGQLYEVPDAPVMHPVPAPMPDRQTPPDLHPLPAPDRPFLWPPPGAAPPPPPPPSPPPPIDPDDELPPF